MDQNNIDVAVRKGAWTPEEDILLRKCIETFGEGKWHLVPLRAGLNRCRKSCRLRWLNYLKPDIKRGQFNTDEVDLIIRLHKLLGNRWSLIAGRLPGRTANDVKNLWNSQIEKKLALMNSSSSSSSNNNNNNSMMINNKTIVLTRNNNNNNNIIRPRPRTFSNYNLPPAPPTTTHDVNNNNVIITNPNNHHNNNNITSQQTDDGDDDEIMMWWRDLLHTTTTTHQDDYTINNSEMQVNNMINEEEEHNNDQMSTGGGAAGEEDEFADFFIDADVLELLSFTHGEEDDHFAGGPIFSK